ncbi:MAG TPA: MoaD/ThiS family protein [Candidatus Binataceae bacterium]|nr:MoaD/ThiS family protein [Candidatus Binataceae bacterium]
MASVVIPSLLRKYTGGVDRAEIAGSSLRELIRNLDAKFPGLGEQLTLDGDLRPSIAVSVDGEIATGGVLEKIGPSSEVHFLPAIGGGSS